MAYLGLHHLNTINTAFNMEDPVMVRYEMIREFVSTGKPAHKVAAKYNYSKSQLYLLLRRFEKQGIEGLKDAKPGPKTPRKMTGEIKERIIQLRTEDDLSITEISDTLKAEGHDISYSTVDRTLEDEGLPKKKPGRKPKTS
jgi:transposase